MRGSRSFPSSFRINPEQSEIEAHAELQLARVVRRCETEWRGRLLVGPAAQVEVGQRRRARRAGRRQPVVVNASPADDVIDALEVGPVEEIEAFDRELHITALFDEEAAGQAHVEAVEGFATPGVSPGLSRTVALRVAVVVGVVAEQQVERPPALRHYDRRQQPVSGNQVFKWALEDAAGHEAMTLVEGRERAVQPQVERILRREVAVVISHFVNRLRERVVRVETEVAGEPLLNLRGEAVVEGIGRRIVDVVLEPGWREEVARRAGTVVCWRGQARETDETWDAGSRVGSDPCLPELVDVVIAREVKAACEEVTQVQRYARAQVALDAEAGLVGRRVAVIRPRRKRTSSGAPGPGLMLSGATSASVIVRWPITPRLNSDW